MSDEGWKHSFWFNLWWTSPHHCMLWSNLLVIYLITSQQLCVFTIHKSGHVLIGNKLSYNVFFVFDTIVFNKYSSILDINAERANKMFLPAVASLLVALSLSVFAVIFIRRYRTNYIRTDEVVNIQWSIVLFFIPLMFTGMTSYF